MCSSEAGGREQLSLPTHILYTGDIHSCRHLQKKTVLSHNTPAPEGQESHPIPHCCTQFCSEWIFPNLIVMHFLKVIQFSHVSVPSEPLPALRGMVQSQSLSFQLLTTFSGAGSYQGRFVPSQLHILPTTGTRAAMQAGSSSF